MFGFISIDPNKLTQEQVLRYKSIYCGLCRSLRDRHGTMARMTLTYDMTFLVLVLCSLYEPNEIGGEETWHIIIALTIGKTIWMLRHSQARD